MPCPSSHLKPNNAERRIRRMYARFNRLYFANQLPRRVAIVIRRYRLAMAITEFCAPGEQPTIGIHAELLARGWENVLAMTLLHEMVHIDIMIKHGARENHGRKFQKRMLDLARAGAFSPYW